MSKTIFVAMDTLVSSQTPPEPTLGHGVPAYAKPFMHWCANNANTVLLTDGPLPHAFRLLSHLGVDKGKVAVRAFESSKTELLHPKHDFYLVDDALIPGEVSWFAEHGLADRIIPVDPHDGVTPETRKHLETKIHGRR